MKMNNSFEPPFKSTGSCTIEQYRQLDQLLEDNPRNLHAIESVMRVLQDYIFSANNREYGQFSLCELSENKREAANRVIHAINGIRFNRIFYQLYLTTVAQCSVVLGNFDDAIWCYESLLEQPGVLDADYDKNYYVGELEYAAKIIHNLCLLYRLNGKSSESISIRRKYNYIFHLEETRTRRLISKDPNNQGYVNLLENMFQKLDEFPMIETFYYDKEFEFAWVLEDSLLERLLTIYEKSGGTYTASLEGEREIRQTPLGILMTDDSSSFLDDNSVVLIK